MRRHFELPEEDAEFLDSLQLSWETVSDNGNWILIHDYPLPNGYNLNEASAALRIESGYPNAQIDMVYFYPHLSRCDGKTIGALAFMQFDGKQWQRWSRHRTGANPWRPELDGVSTHTMLVNHWLSDEFRKR